MSEKIQVEYGIYRCVNKVTGRSLVGQVGSTQTFGIRRSRYLHLLRKNGYKYNKHFQRSFSKYGEENFEMEILERMPIGSLTLDEHKPILTAAEQRWLDHFRASLGGVYNQIGPADSPTRGRKMSDEQKQKMSAMKIGVKRGPMSEQQKKKLSIAHTGKTMPRDAIERGASKRRGRKATDEHRVNQSAAMIGREVSPETRKKIAATLTGRKRPTEAVQKMSAARRGKPLLEKRKWIERTNVKTGETKVYHGSPDVEADGFSQANVSACCLGKRKTHKGFAWKYIEQVSTN